MITLILLCDIFYPAIFWWTIILKTIRKWRQFRGKLSTKHYFVCEQRLGITDLYLFIYPWFSNTSAHMPIFLQRIHILKQTTFALAHVCTQCWRACAALSRAGACTHNKLLSLYPGQQNHGIYVYRGTFCIMMI